MATGIDQRMEAATGRPTLRRRHIFAVTLGNALEFYDFVTFGFFAIQIGHALFPTQNTYSNLMLSLATFGTGFLSRPLGALVIGAYADRVGRKAAMTLSFTLMGASIIAMALIPSYATIGLAAPILAVIARLLQGFSMGGEVGSNTAYLLEASPRDKRGLIVSLQGASQNVAVIIAGAVGILLTAALPPGTFEAHGWRIAFLLGAATLPFGLWLRRSLPETLHEPETDTAAPVVDAPRLHQARRSSRIFLLGFVVLAASTIGGYVLDYIATYAQDTLHMSAAAGFAALTCSNALGIVSLLYAGRLSDRIGRWPVNVGANLATLVLVYPVFQWIVATRSELVLIFGMSVLGLVANCNAGCFYAGLAESLPKSIRGSGFGTLYALSVVAFGGTTQLVVTWLIHTTGNVLVPAWYLVAATAVAQVAYMLMPESAPVRLRAAAAPA